MIEAPNEIDPKNKKSEKNPTAPVLGFSCLAFADHSPPSRLSGQQNENPRTESVGLGEERDKNNYKNNTGEPGAHTRASSQERSDCSMRAAVPLCEKPCRRRSARDTRTAVKRDLAKKKRGTAPNPHSSQRNDAAEPSRFEARQSQRSALKGQASLLFDNTQATSSNDDPTRDLSDWRLLKMREVAAILGCKLKDAYTLSYECGLPTRKLRGRVRVLGSDLKKWLEGLPSKRRLSA